MLTLCLRIAAIAGFALTGAAVPAAAADLGLGPEPGGRSAAEMGVRTAIVVPDCVERSSAKLLGCLPREEPDSAQDPGLLQIEGTMMRVRRLPYPQLVDRP